jgi:tripartite-type tricarboxylate transporter receptor subunit TctC
MRPAGCRRLAAPLALLLVAGTLPAIAADPVAEFYAGKTVRVLVGFGPGGGYDLYARTLARYFGRYIPGQPTIVAQNVPGAGSLKVVNYLYNAAPKDGTAIATFARGIVFEPLLGHTEGTQFDAARLNWIGSISNEVGVCGLMRESGIASWADMRTKPFRIGASGSGADSDIFPVVLRNLFGLPMKLVAGYQGGAEMVLAMERHEIDGRCGWSWTSLISRDKALYDARQIAVTLQIALAKHEDLPDVPLVTDLVDDPQKLAALRLIVSRQNIARPFAAPPGVPADRLAALRAAMMATFRDPAFRADCQAQRLDCADPKSGEEIASLIRTAYGTPDDIRKRLIDIYQAGQGAEERK